MDHFMLFPQGLRQTMVENFIRAGAAERVSRKIASSRADKE
jgi:hypothetical protein